jgi:hypothetical protein
MRRAISHLRLYLSMLAHHRRLVSNRQMLIETMECFSRWQRSQGRTPIMDRMPWMTFKAIDWLSDTLEPGWRVFEYSSGGSTLFFLDHGVDLVSVEHDPIWYQSVRAKLSEQGVKSGCDYRLVRSTTSETRPPTCPSRRCGDPSADFAEYTRTIDEFPDETFDLVCIDGRARVECTRHAMRKVKRHGFIVLDNSERNDYGPVYDLLAAWDKREFYGIGPYNAAPWKTTVWQAPE